MSFRVRTYLVCDFRDCDNRLFINESGLSSERRQALVRLAREHGWSVTAYDQHAVCDAH